MAGVLNSEAAAPMRILLHVLRLWSGIGIGAVIQPSFHNEGWRLSAIFVVETTTSHYRGNHLAAVRQVGEGTSPRLDEHLNNI
jgi:hypothetical protein